MTHKPRLHFRQEARGFTLLELMVVCALVGTLAAVALGRLWDLQADVEEVMAEQVVGALKNAARIRAVELMSAARWDEFRSMPRHNPFDWLEEQPRNYRGELPGSPEPGNWYFDRKSSVAIYYIKHGEGFSSTGVEPVMRFHVVGLDSAGRPVTQPSFSWVGVRPLAEYVWRGKMFAK